MAGVVVAYLVVVCAFSLNVIASQIHRRRKAWHAREFFCIFFPTRYCPGMQAFKRLDLHPKFRDEFREKTWLGGIGA